MKVTVIGGSGVFGERLCRLLARDGHHLTIAARNLARAEGLAQQLGARSLCLDRGGDLSALAGAAVVVDAAGPFRVADDWRVARWCIAAGVHYLDLSDNAAFTAGINALDADARATGVCVLSGLSSVPGLSSAVVTDLAQGLDRIAAIDSAILPGNRAPRGRAVMESILGQVGQPFDVRLGGVLQRQRGWSGPRTYHLAPGLIRRGWAIAVPDQTLFPTHFACPTVTFRAGLELGLMNRGLALMSGLLAAVRQPFPRWGIAPLAGVARALAPFGTDRGGMVVTVTGPRDGQWVARRWTLIAERGEGPFIPTVAVRALLRDPSLLVPGARAALGAVRLDAVEQAMVDLAVRCQRSETRIQPLFARVLGPAWPGLPDRLRAGHDVSAPLVMRGQASVTRGQGLMARLTASLFRFPAAGDGPVSVTMDPTERGEVWTRRFGPRRFRSHLAYGADRNLTERFGPLTFTIALRAQDGVLHWPVVAGRIGPLPIPRWLLPVSVAREWEQDGRFQFDVSLSLPLRLGLVVRYRGWLVPV